MYDQNRPEEPQRQSGDEKPARRRIGRSWAPAEEGGDEPGPQGAGQQGEQYRFDPDRGRRHRYSDDPNGKAPGVPVEIAETGPLVPATRRPSPGEQFEPIPPAPPQAQRPESPFAPPAQAPADPQTPAPEFSAPQTPGPDFAPPHQPGPEFSAPQTPGQEFPATGPVQHYSAPQQSAPAVPSAPPTPPPAAPVEGTEPPTGQLPVTEAHQASSPPAHPTPSVPGSLPSPPPPVTEQANPRTPPTSRQPLAEPTPPVTADDPQDPEAAALLERVRRVPGVRDAYHVTAPDGNPSLRLELDEGVDPDEVHAAVSAVVNDRAPAPAPTEEPAPPAEEPADDTDPAAVEAVLPSLGTVELRRVEIDSSGLEAEVAVTLALGDLETAGAVTAPPVDWHIEHAAAAATVEALRPHLGAGDARVQVEHASIVPTGPVTTAVVVVLWLDGRAVRRLAGASVVASERVRAIVSATLSALAAEMAH